MSEYQYYEFQAIDRPLSREEMAELRAVSTRAEITPTRFTNFYTFGNFKGKPERWMEKYFDAFVYVANWGTHWFMLRLPKRLLDLETAKLYFPVDDVAIAWEKGDYVIFSFLSEDLESDWEESGEEWLPSLITLRGDIANGDLRSLYLGWLLCAQTALLDEDLEPPVPPGLGELSASLEDLIDFLGIDEDLLAVAAERSLSMTETVPEEPVLEMWIHEMRDHEKDEILLRLIRGDDPHLRFELRQRFQRAQEAGEPADVAAGLRTVGELLAAAEQRAEIREREEAKREAEERARREREQAAARSKYLDGLAGH